MLFNFRKTSANITTTTAGAAGATIAKKIITLTADVLKANMWP